MEVVHQHQEFTMGSSSHDYLHVVNKRKRTKRQRQFSPQPLPITTTSSNGGGGGGGGGDDHHNLSLPTTSVEFSGGSEEEEEEEDMANCLILLAQGGHDRRRFRDSTSTNSKGGLNEYQCKTCNKCFPSFQALGGHRASHKRPNKQSILPIAFLEQEEEEEDQTQFNGISPPSLTIQMENSTSTSNKSRVHECSICGSKFSSGQALGGHMRRHRSSNAAAATTTISTTSTTNTHMLENHQEIIKKPKNVFYLDLNLPAPEEERESRFFFNSKQQPLIFSASPLVDCHY